MTESTAENQAESDDSEPETPEQEETEGDQPEINEGEMADFSAVAAEIEAADADADTDQDGDESDQTESDESDESDGESPAAQPDGVSFGKVYTNALGMSAAVARSKHGSLDPSERDRMQQEYAEMARQIELDQYMDRWLQESGGLDGLSPGQAVLLGSLMWGGMVLMDDPEMLENITQEVRDR